MSDQVWVQLRGFGTKVPAKEADQRARELMEFYGRPIATVHPLSCRLAYGSEIAEPGMVTCSCLAPRWIRRGEGQVPK